VVVVYGCAIESQVRSRLVLKRNDLHSILLHAFSSAYYVFGESRPSLPSLFKYSPSWFPGIPFGIWLAFDWNLGLHGLWIGLTISLVYSAVLGTLLSVRTDWDREVKKVMERLKEEDKMRQADIEGH